MTKSAWEVWKFGGVSLADGRAMRDAITRIQKHHGPLAVVASALAGVTDLLRAGADAASRGGRDEAVKAAATLKRKPSIERIARIVSGRDAVAAAFHRHQSFCTAHTKNLRAGEFLIGMVSGHQQRTERKFLESVLPAKERFATLSAIESRKRIAEIQKAGSNTFDLIDDYLVPVVWHALRLALGPAGSVTEAPPANPQPAIRSRDSSKTCVTSEHR